MLPRGSGDHSEDEYRPSKAVQSQKSSSRPKTHGSSSASETSAASEVEHPFKGGMVPQDYTISSNQSYSPASDARQYSHHGQQPCPPVAQPQYGSGFPALYPPVAHPQYGSIFPTQYPPVAEPQYGSAYAPSGQPQYAPDSLAPPSVPVGEASPFLSGACKSAGSTSKQPRMGNDSDKLYPHEIKCTGSHGCGQVIQTVTTDNDEPLRIKYEYDDERCFLKSTSFYDGRTGRLVENFSSDGGIGPCSWHRG